MAVFPYQFIKENPTSYIEMPKYDQQVEKIREDLKIITMEQYQQILNITPFSSPFNVPLQIAFGTGMRRGEVCGLEWNAVDLEAHTIDIHQTMLQLNKKWIISTPKTQASYRNILIGQSLVDLLKRKRKDQMEQKMRYGKYYYDSNFVCTKKRSTSHPILYQIPC